MQLKIKLTILLLYLHYSTGYLYYFAKPGYKHRVGKIKRDPDLIPCQMPFYTKKVNATNTTH